jgi:vancomycin aglycone glucosyltransferase
MRVLLSTFGSRGDVEPMAGLAVRLRALGAEVRVCAPPDEEFAELLARAGAPLAPAFTPVRQWTADAIANRPPMDLPRRAAGVLTAQFEAISAAAKGCDAVLAAGLFPSTAAAQCVAEQRGIPYVYATFCPLVLPSTHHRPFAYPGHPHPAEVTDNRVLWDRDVQTMNAVFGEALNAHRLSIGLPTVDNVRDHVFTDRPWLASDPTLSPWQPTDLRDVVQTGAWILLDDRPLPSALEAFLISGPPPVYVGFGSMPMQALKDAARVAIEAVRAQGRRVLLSHGWAELALIDDQVDCLAVGEVNQQALFGRVAAVVPTAARAPRRRPQRPQRLRWWSPRSRISRIGPGVWLNWASARRTTGRLRPPSLCQQRSGRP